MLSLAAGALVSPGDPGDPPDPPDPPVTMARPVTDFAGTYRLGGVSANQVTYQFKHTFRRTVTRFRVYYQSNWWGAVGTQVDLHLDGASITVGGVLIPLTFSGSPSLIITPGTFAVSDWVNTPVVAGTDVSVRTCWAAGTFHPKQAWAGATATQGAGRPVAPFGNYTVAGSGAIPILNVTDNGYGMLMVEGDTESTGPSVALLGDSICEGASDTSLLHGFLPRGIADSSIPWTNFGVFADTPPIAALPLGREGRYGPALPLHTHAICQYPINTLNAASTFNGSATAVLNFWNWVAAQGVELWQTTVSPSNRSSDAWATPGNQTPGLSNNGNHIARIGFNDWVRDGAPTVAGVVVAAGSVDPTALRAGAVGHPLTGYIEVADSVETARNSGIWITNGTANYMTADGTHPSAAAHALMSAPIAAWAAAL